MDKPVFRTASQFLASLNGIALRLWACHPGIATLDASPPGVGLARCRGCRLKSRLDPLVELFKFGKQLLVARFQRLEYLDAVERFHDRGGPLEVGSTWAGGLVAKETSLRKGNRTLLASVPTRSTPGGLCSFSSDFALA